ncbi:hypothetical protein PGTUg99_007585 [Puccinia graminis f. sp. tritici]|uniref:Pentacotripeptide-repeat region of PRORP domain-containing protein n=1 Tax=Puccinia graminis f. sp. tritici TaxID=56615 RepID=A0A5B0S9Y1_PUCGR|nr:hypothetical protein PGTUg99_007585 [Puccinia graminis f. sp. tritici]
MKGNYYRNFFMFTSDSDPHFPASLRLAPNTTTLNHFLNYHSRLQHPVLDEVLDKVLDYLKRFEALSVKPDVVSFTILLNILMKLGLGHATIEKLLLMMDHAGVDPNAITYGSIIHHLCRSGKIEDVEVARKLLEEIEERGIATTDIIYRALNHGFLPAHVQEYEARTEGFRIEPGRGSSEGANEAGRGTKLSWATELSGPTRPSPVGLPLAWILVRPTLLDGCLGNRQRPGGNNPPAHDPWRPRARARATRDDIQKTLPKLWRDRSLRAEHDPSRKIQENEPHGWPAKLKIRVRPLIGQPASRAAPVASCQPRGPNRPPSSSGRWPGPFREAGAQIC